MSIAGNMTDIAENIITSYNTRAKEFANTVTRNHQMLQGFAQERQRMNRRFKQMSAAQAENLAGFAGGIARDVKSLLHGFHKEMEQVSQNRLKNAGEFKKKLKETVEEIRADTRHNLKKFKQAHSQMSEQQKEALARNAKDRVGEVKKILSASRGFISKCGEDMNKAANIWRNMTSTLAKARNGAGTTMVEERAEKVKSHKKGKKGRKIGYQHNDR